MSDTLNTEGAARFLGVSEASVRRWSDLGLLAVERSGRRRVRRFAVDELARFRTREAAPAERMIARRFSLSSTPARSP